MITACKVQVRPAGPADEDLFFAWRNEPWIVQAGSSRRAVPREEHHAWFGRTLTGEERELFVVEIDGRAAGMVRYDWREASLAEISTYLLPEFWGQGHGREVFNLTAPAVCVRRNLRGIIARVLAGNDRSLAFFQRLGFRAAASAPAEGLHTLVLETPPVRHSRCSIADEEIAAVVSVLKSGQIAQGAGVADLEQRWSRDTATTAAAGVGSGVAALRLALVALGVGSGHEVIVPAYSCVALLNAVLAVGATPVLADVMPGTWTLSPADVSRRLTARTKAIIAVHLFGAPAAIGELSALGVPVIEDCAHGIGGRVDGRPFGSAGALSISSFYATKMIAGGEGGIVAGHDARHIERIRRARDYGDQAPSGLHLNDKLTDITAAIVQGQLNRLPETLSERSRLASAYDDALQPLADEGRLELPPVIDGRIWYRYAVRLASPRARAVSADMAARDVRAEQPVWDLRETPAWRGDCPATAEAFDHVLSLPLHPGLSPFDQQRVCAALYENLRNS
jgi:perosamine synthetase